MTIKDVSQMLSDAEVGKIPNFRYKREFAGERPADVNSVQSGNEEADTGNQAED